MEFNNTMEIDTGSNGVESQDPPANGISDNTQDKEIASQNESFEQNEDTQAHKEEDDYMPSDSVSEPEDDEDDYGEEEPADEDEEDEEYYGAWHL
jgi:hypothetical protein